LARTYKINQIGTGFQAQFSIKKYNDDQLVYTNYRANMEEAEKEGQGWVDGKSIIKTTTKEVGDKKVPGADKPKNGDFDKHMHQVHKERWHELENEIGDLADISWWLKGRRTNGDESFESRHMGTLEGVIGDLKQKQYEAGEKCGMNQDKELPF